MRKLVVLFIALIGFQCQAELIVRDAIIRLLPPGVPNTSVYFEIQNTGQNSEVLVSASSDIAQRIEMHNHIMSGDSMRMEQIHAVEIAAGETLVFEPMGKHLMVFGLHQPLAEGHTVTVKLHTRSGLTVSVPAEVSRP